MFSFLSRKNLEGAASELVHRFPLSLVMIVVTAGLFFYSITVDTSTPEISRAIFTSIVLFFSSVGMVLAREVLGKNIRWYTIVSVSLMVLYGVWFYTTLDTDILQSSVSIVLFILHMVGFVGFLFAAPYIFEWVRTKKVGEISYSNYFVRLSWTFLMSGIVGGSLMLLGFIAIGSVTTLFDLHFDHIDRAYAYWAVIALVVLAPLYGLKDIPKLSEIDAKKFEVNRFFAFLIRFVAIPFIFIYFVILYAYSIRVLINFGNWPKGMIAWMVIGFSVFGYITYIFSRSYSEGKVIPMFRKYFPWIVLPQIAMLAYAIYLRTSQYGLTTNRYFVIIFGAWLLVVSLYYVASRTKSLIVLPLSLSLISLIISVGPWSVFSLPHTIQSARLIKNLETAHILKDGKIVPLEKYDQIDRVTSGEIAAEIDYLCGYEDCKKIQEIFPEQYEKISAEDKKTWGDAKPESGQIYTGPSHWTVSEYVKKAIRVQNLSMSEDGIAVQKEKYLQYNRADPKVGYDIFPLDISGYEKLLTIENMYNESMPNRPYPFFLYHPDDQTLRYMTASGVYTSFPIVIPDGFTAQAGGEKSGAELTFTSSGSDMEIRAIFQSLPVKNPRYIEKNPKDNPYPVVSGYVLVRKKK